MPILSVSPTVGLSRSIAEGRDLLSELQSQLASGKRVKTYGDLGTDRTQILSFRSELSQIEAYGDTIAQTNIRLDVMQLVVERIRDLASEDFSDALEVGFQLENGGKTIYQIEAAARFDEVVSLLNTDLPGRHLFGGRETESYPVAPAAEILYGTGTQAGFKQIASERRQADLGADGRGRLVIPVPVGAVVSMAEDAVGSPFGFKLTGTSSAATTTGSAIANTADLGAGITGYNDGAAATVTGAVVGTPGDIGGPATAQFTIDIGGNAQTFDISDAGNDTLAALEAAIDTAFGANVATIVGGNQLQLTATNKTDTITITDVDAGAALLAGLTEAVTTNPTPAANDLFRVTVNAVDYDFRIGTDAGEVNTLTDLVNAINGTAVLNGLVTANPIGSSLSITSDDTVTPFTIAGDADAVAGLGLTAGLVNPGSGATSTLTGTTVTGPAGAPASIDVTFTATLPQDGEFVRLTLDLPDGTQTEVTLTARTAAPTAPGEFQIGADENATAANFQAALDTIIQTEAQTSLSAASLFEAAENFFDFDGTTPPQRVDGPPFDTATALRDGTTADTVFWYQGELSTTPARDSALAKVDDAIMVSYGARANEEAFRTTLKNLAAVAVESFSVGDANGAARYNEMKQRAISGLAFPSGTQNLDSVATELAIASTQVASASERHGASKALLQGIVDDVESADIFEVSTQILALQGRIEASLQVSASLGRLSLVNYL